LLRHQVNEITSANLSAEEETQIESRYRSRVTAAVIEIASGVATKLSEADDAILSRLGETQKLLHELEKLDPRWRRRRIRMKRRWSSYRRLRADLSRYAENLDLDPEQFVRHRAANLAL